MNKNKTKVYHITFHEYQRLAHIFFWGCNFDCKGCLRKTDLFNCHVPLSAEREKNTSFFNIEDIIELLKPIKLKIALFGGWEPTLDPSLCDIASSFHSHLKTWNYLLTNGYDIPERALSEIDEVKVSIKAYSDEIHRDYTGKSNYRVLQNFKKIYDDGIKLSAETVLMPGYVDVAEIRKIAKFISSIDENIPLRIDAYWEITSKEWRAPTKEEMMRAVKEARKCLNNVTFLCGDESVKGEVVKVV